MEPYPLQSSTSSTPKINAAFADPKIKARRESDDAVVIDLKIFENTGTAVALLDEMASKVK